MRMPGWLRRLTTAEALPPRHVRDAREAARVDLDRQVTRYRLDAMAARGQLRDLATGELTAPARPVTPTTQLVDLTTGELTAPVREASPHTESR